MAEEDITELEDKDVAADVCDVGVEKATLDQDLPLAQGGMITETSRFTAEGTIALEFDDPEKHLDGGDVTVEKATLDEYLPNARGGVN